MTADVVDFLWWRTWRTFRRHPGIRAELERRRHHEAVLAQHGLAECESCGARVAVVDVRLGRCPRCAPAYEAYLIETAREAGL